MKKWITFFIVGSFVGIAPASHTMAVGSKSSGRRLWTKRGILGTEFENNLGKKYRELSVQRKKVIKSSGKNLSLEEKKNAVEELRKEAVLGVLSEKIGGAVPKEHLFNVMEGLLRTKSFDSVLKILRGEVGADVTGLKESVASYMALLGAQFDLTNSSEMSSKANNNETVSFKSTVSKAVESYKSSFPKSFEIITGDPQIGTGTDRSVAEIIEAYDTMFGKIGSTEKWSTSNLEGFQNRLKALVETPGSNLIEKILNQLVESEVRNFYKIVIDQKRVIVGRERRHLWKN